MIDLYEATTNRLIGSISDADLQTLADALEEESAEDQDYFIDQATIDMLAEAGTPEHVLALLRGAVGSGEGLEIRWERRP